MTTLTEKLEQLNPGTSEADIVALLGEIAAGKPSDIAVQRYTTTIATKTNVRINTIRNLYFRAVQPLDKCHFCAGRRGGTPGNENIVHGLTICDYCHADIIKVERAVRDDTLRAAGRLAVNEAKGTEERMAANGFYDLMEEVRLTLDGRWKSDKAMAMWHHAASHDGERLHEQYDGNGRERRV